MRITYDPEVDALYIELRHMPAHDSLDIEEGVTADLDTEGHIIGLEVLDARDRLGNEAVTSAPVEVLAPGAVVQMCETCIHADPRRGMMLVYCRHIERLRVLTHPACADYAVS